MKNTPTMAPNWAEMIIDLRRLMMTFYEIGQAMDSVLTERMLKHYAAGAQPAHWRGELLIALWINKTNKKREDLPMCAVIRGHRAVRKEVEQGPRLQNLPQWPAVKNVISNVKPKGKPGRKPKTVAEV